MDPQQKPKVKCHHCGKLRHIKKFCRKLKAEKEKSEGSEKAAISAVKEDSDSESSALVGVADQALSVSSSNEQRAWIVDSGATSHMCRDKKSFSALYQSEDPVDVVLGDGRTLSAVGRGNVELDMVLPNGKVKSCTLYDVLYVPDLSYNLVSVAKASQKGKVVKFTKSACYILDKQHRMFAKATKVGGLYKLDYKLNHERANVVEQSESKEDLWHKRFGHLGVGSLQSLARERLVDGFDFDSSKRLTFCETCPQAKQHRSKFSASSTKAAEPLGLVHSDLCGKMNVKSHGGAEYFLNFIDDKTRYVWVYFLHHKDEVFEKFRE